MQAGAENVHTLDVCAPVTGNVRLATVCCDFLPRPTARRAGFSLIELLCVCVIISILASLLLPAVARAYRRAQAMQEEFEASAVFEMLLGATWNYCAAHPKYKFDSKQDFAEKCGLPSKCRAWINSSHTEFESFDHLAPTNLIVLTFQYGPKYASRRAFNKAELCIRPQEE